jgi:hypothetical protein
VFRFGPRTFNLIVLPFLTQGLKHLSIKQSELGCVLSSSDFTADVGKNWYNSRDLGLSPSASVYRYGRYGR